MRWTFENKFIIKTQKKYTGILPILQNLGETDNFFDFRSKIITRTLAYIYLT